MSTPQAKADAKANKAAEKRELKAKADAEKRELKVKADAEKRELKALENQEKKAKADADKLAKKTADDMEYSDEYYENIPVSVTLDVTFTHTLTNIGFDILPAEVVKKILSFFDLSCSSFYEAQSKVPKTSGRSWGISKK